MWLEIPDDVIKKVILAAIGATDCEGEETSVLRRLRWHKGFKGVEGLEVHESTQLSMNNAPKFSPEAKCPAVEALSFFPSQASGTTRRFHLGNRGKLHSRTRCLKLVAGRPRCSGVKAHVRPPVGEGSLCLCSPKKGPRMLLHLTTTATCEHFLMGFDSTSLHLHTGL